MKSFNLQTAILMFSLTAMLGAIPAGAYTLSEWPLKVPMVINTSTTGANVGTSSVTFSSFPMLVRLNAQNFDFSQAKDDGSDLRFSRSLVAGSENERPYHIERWDKTNKVAEIWVMMDQIKGGTDGQILYLHWGHLSPPAPLSTSVFDGTYKGVWHMGESGSTLTGSVLSRNGTKRAANDPKQDNGLIGKAQHFGTGQYTNDNTEDYVDLGTDVAYTASVQRVTLEAWVKWDGSTSGGKIVGFSKNNSTGARAKISVDADGKVRLEARSNDTEGLKTLLSSPSTLPSLVTGTWYYIVGIIRYDQNYMQICANNVCQSQSSVGFGNTTLPSTPNTNNVIGAEGDKASAFFHGIVDEVRVSVPSSSQPADWHKLVYENTKSTSALITFPGTYLPLAGGIMYGEINMNGFQLNNASVVVTNKWRIPDYVFEPGYRLPSVEETHAYVSKHKHLPGVPSAAELEAKGMDLAEMNLALLKQVEHLQLYILEQEKRIRKLERN